MQDDGTYQWETEHNPVVRLASLWQKHRKQLYGVFPPSLTRRELGQLKGIRRRVGPFAFFVTHWTLENWKQFSERAKINAGTPTAPPDPHIGFLLAHLNTAINQMVSAAKTIHPLTLERAYFKERIQQMCTYLKEQNNNEQSVT